MVRSATFAVIAAAAVALAAPAQAQVLPTKPVPLADLFNAWKTICHDNMFDTDAQVRVAKAAPFGTIEGATDEEGTREFRSGTMIVWISGGPKNHYCAVAGNLSQTPVAGDGERLLGPLFGKPTETEVDRTFWTLDKPEYTLTVGYGAGTTLDGIPGVLIGSGVDMK